MPGIGSRERWLVSRDGRIIVQTAMFHALGFEVPPLIVSGGIAYKFVEVNDGVEVYEEEE